MPFAKGIVRPILQELLVLDAKKQGIIFSDSKGEENCLASVGITNNMVNKSQLGKCVYTFTVSSEDAGFIFSIFSEHLVVEERVIVIETHRESDRSFSGKIAKSVMLILTRLFLVKIKKNLVCPP